MSRRPAALGLRNESGRLVRRAHLGSSPSACEMLALVGRVIGQRPRPLSAAVLICVTLLGVLAVDRGAGAAPSSCSQVGTKCGLILVHLDADHPPYGWLRTSLRDAQGVVSRARMQNVEGIDGPLRLTAPPGNYSLQVAARPCNRDCEPRKSNSVVSCRIDLTVRAGRTSSAFVILGAHGCSVQITPGLGPTIAIRPDRAIARIRVGETSSEIGRTYGRGQVHIHPATRTYDIAHQDVLAQFDHYERATNLESTGDALSLYGQRLSRGWAYWQPRLAARGWHTFTCDGSHEAISPHRRTSLLIDKDRLDVQIDSDHYSGPFSTRCFIAAP